MFIVYLHTLQTVDFLDFIHDITRQRVHALQPENIVGCRRAVYDCLAFFHVFSLKDVDMTPLRHQQFMALPVLVGNYQSLFAFRILAEAYQAGLLRQNAGFLGFSCLEQIGNPGQPAGDVAGLK